MPKAKRRKRRIGPIKGSIGPGEDGESKSGLRKERGSRSRRIRRGKGRRTRVGMSAAIHFRETLVNFSS